jgi:hypothetical protein
MGFNIAFLHYFSQSEPAGIRMLLLCTLLLFHMKVIVLVEDQIPREKKLSKGAWWAFTLFWFGMKPSLFLSFGEKALPEAFLLIRAGLIRMVLGLLLMGSAYGFWHSISPSYGVMTLLLLPGISLILHFGILQCSAGFWRFFGVPTQKLFHAPLYATNLNEFWGKRWNIAYSEMIQLSVYRPLSGVMGKPFALFLSFSFSGLLHEIAISFPVQRYYGLPTLYFVLHGALMSFERSRLHQGKPIDRQVWKGRVWVFFWMVLPLPILFHPPFLAGTIWPLIGVMN